MFQKTIEDFLEIIQKILIKKGYVKNKDIAEELKIAPPSATATLKKLKEEGLIEYTKYENVTLTEKGKKIAEEVKRTHENLKKFLLSLSISEEISEKDACKIEHDLSTETKEKILLFVKFLEKNKDIVERFKIFCKFPDKISLAEMKQDEKGRIVGFDDENFITEVEKIGIRAGKEFKVISKQPYGPLTIKIDEQEIAIGKGIAKKIYVEKI